jgi:hypothetical protein
MVKPFESMFAGFGGVEGAETTSNKFTVLGNHESGLVCFHLIRLSIIQQAPRHWQQ